MRQYIWQIILLLFTLASANINCECVKNIFPKGEWIKTAINPKLNGNILCADLKLLNKSEYIQSCIIFENSDILFNINGKFSKKVTTHPLGSWKYSAKDITLENNILCAYLLNCEDNKFIKSCVLVAEGDIFENNKGTFRLTKFIT